MKQNNNNRRARGRGPRKPHGMGGGQHKVQGYEGGGQELRVRGNAYQVLEKYLQLARDAGAAGDRIAAENFLQHADHYYRVLSAMNEGQRPRMGGRELSVADVNVQNVSQGLSAALYTSGGPNPHGMESGMQGDGMEGQNRGNQGQQGQGAQGGHRQGGHPHGGHQHGGPQQGRSHAESQGQQAASGGNIAQSNGHGNSYGNYERAESQPSYPSPSQAPRAAAPAVNEEQPDYPDELLPSPGAPGTEASLDNAGEGVQRTLRAPRPRPRGPRRGGPRPGDGRPGDGRQGDGGQGDGGQSEAQGPGQAESD